MTRPQQEQIGQHRDPHGICAPLLVSSDLLVAQSQPRCACPIYEFDGPVFLVDAHHLSRGQLRQIGHQNFGLLRAQVVLENSNGYITPLLAEVVPLFRSLPGSLSA